MNCSRLVSTERQPSLPSNPRAPKEASNRKVGNRGGQDINGRGNIVELERSLPLKESFGPRKENNSLKGPLLNHGTSEKTKDNFSSILMHLSGTYQPLSGNLPPPPPTQKTYHPLPNYKCHLNKRILKISRLIDVSLIASTNLPIKYEASLILFGAPPGR